MLAMAAIRTHSRSLSPGPESSGWMIVDEMNSRQSYDSFSPHSRRMQSRSPLRRQIGGCNLGEIDDFGDDIRQGQAGRSDSTNNHRDVEPSPDEMCGRNVSPGKLIRPRARSNGGDGLMHRQLTMNPGELNRQFCYDKLSEMSAQHQR